ncbi:hypothetical protein Pmani_026112 [Petrolisthes manimaculis]|uniref:Uncharacterized protein n=1 Tax=Petrolisthes manimaculis TaxID=1843537 RepID=A0AAE1U0F5_9EUCA|nr:hypothetical protein Pmani_026112 [Petrolisthes manimaculis]
MLLKVCVVAVVLGLTLARPDPSFYKQHHGRQGHYRPQPYSFSYGVQDGYSGQNFGRKESSDGKTVLGAYSVDLPDGRKQTVNYRADPYSGFQADVSYTGHSHGHVSHHY